MGHQPSISRKQFTSMGVPAQKIYIPSESHVKRGIPLYTSSLALHHIWQHTLWLSALMLWGCWRVVIECYRDANTCIVTHEGTLLFLAFPCNSWNFFYQYVICCILTGTAALCMSKHIQKLSQQYKLREKTVWEAPTMVPSADSASCKYWPPIWTLVPILAAQRFIQLRVVA